MRHALRFVPLLALSLAQAGCPTERMPPPKEAMPAEDEWSRIPPSKEWLFATSDFNGPHKAECDHVLGWVKGEDACKASLCEHGKDLAAEWLTRCTPLEDAGPVAEVRAAQTALTARTADKPTECAKQYDDLVREGCGGDDPACLSAGQRWATRCAKHEGTPLVMRILLRAIDRRMEKGSEPVELDLRTCDELRADVVEAGKCKDRFVCAEAIPRVAAYRDRCESDAERPTLATAVNELTVLVGGNKPPEVILTRADSPALGTADVSVALADGSGGVITVCDERASDLARYVGSRRGCQGGKMVVARAFPTSKGLEVRVGALDFPDDATFSARYPTIVAAGELDLRDRESAAALDAELRKAVDLGKTTAGAPEAARVAARAVLAHVLAIKRSPAAKAALSRHDEGLVPVLRELGKAKVAASKAKLDAADGAGFVPRGKTRPFADVGPDGAVLVGAVTRAFTLDTTSILPRATEAHAAALKGARSKKATAAAERARGIAAGQACGASLKKLSETKKALASCNFGLEACDDARHAQLVKTVDEERLAAETAFHQLESARTGGAATEADALTRAAEAAGCREPWW